MLEVRQEVSDALVLQYQRGELIQEALEGLNGLLVAEGSEWAVVCHETPEDNSQAGSMPPGDARLRQRAQIAVPLQTELPDHFDLLFRP